MHQPKALIPIRAFLCPETVSGVTENAMKLSVIIPVYNMEAEGRVKFCLDSLLGQMGAGEMEILAVDDCSTDGSFAILQEYEKNHPGVVKALRTKKNLHQGGAKNLGLSAASGEWIAFIDADDWVAPDYFAKLLGRAEETGADCVGCDYSLVTEHTFEVGRVVHNSRPEQSGVLDKPRYRSLLLDFGSLCTKVYRREIILDCPSRFPEGMFYEDNALAKTWIMRMKHFEYVREPLYYYYQHGGSTVHTVSMERLEDRRKAGRMMLEEAKRYGYAKEYHPELTYSFTVLFFQNTLFSCMQSRLPGSFSFVRSLRDEMKKLAPDFEENGYYRERTNAEEKRFMHLCMQSPAAFFAAYRLLWFYRKHLRPLLKGRNR